MIPIHFKLAAAVVMLSGAFWFGMDYQKGKQAKKEVKVIVKQVENHASDIKSLEKDTKKIAELERQLARSLADVRTVDVSITCPVRQLEQLHNETISAVNSMRKPN